VSIFVGVANVLPAGATFFGNGRDGLATLALMLNRRTRELPGRHLSPSGKAIIVSSALEQALIARFGTLGRVRSFLH
jgi:hypothetical protein